MEITDVPHLIIMIIITLACAKVAALLSNKIGIPALIGWVIIGVVFAHPFIGDTNSVAGLLKINVNSVSGSEGSLCDIMGKISEVGIVFFIFSIGLKTLIKDLMSVGKTAFTVAFFGVLFPFSLGYFFVKLFYDSNGDHALFLAASMVATSIGVTAYIIQNLHLFHTKEAKIIIGAAIIDDILGMIILAFVSYKLNSGDSDLGNICLYTFLLIPTLLLSICIIIPYIQKIIRKNNRTKFVPLAFSISFCIILAFITEKLHLTSFIGSFIAGLILSKYAESWELNKKIELIASCVIPFFFINLGLNINIYNINGQIALITSVVLLAIIGKYFGCLLGAKLSDKSMSIGSANIVGIGMIPRGEVGILVASIGLSIVMNDGEHAMSSELCTAVIFMSVITTLIAPPLLSIAFKKRYKDNINLKE